jgi:hypothetical protein
MRKLLKSFKTEINPTVEQKVKINIRRSALVDTSTISIFSYNKNFTR